eukprot:2117024-Amphidinium_carterae.2
MQIREQFLRLDVCGPCIKAFLNHMSDKRAKRGSGGWAWPMRQLVAIPDNKARLLPTMSEPSSPRKPLRAS